MTQVQMQKYKNKIAKFGILCKRGALRNYLDFSHKGQAKYLTFILWTL